MMTPALRNTPVSDVDGVGTMAKVVQKLVQPSSKRNPLTPMEAAALAALASNISDTQRSTSTVRSLNDSAVAADLVKLLVDTLNAPLSEHSIQAHKVMLEAYNRRNVPDDDEEITFAPLQYEDQRRSLQVQLESAKFGSAVHSVEDVQAKIDALEERYQKAQNQKIRFEARRQVIEERRKAVSSAQTDFQESISKHSERVEALATEYEKLAAILMTCAVTAKNALHYDLFGTTEYQNMVSSNRATARIADEFEGLISKELKSMLNDMKLAYRHTVRMS